MSDERLIVFVKAPRPGRVKTRLRLGPTAECAAYQRLVRAVLAELVEFRRVELRFAPNHAAPEIAPWLFPGWRGSPQGGGDLGSRLNRAFNAAFAAGAKRVVIIGSDCPYLRASDIKIAWAALKTHDLVLGPARDGGYWLIGLRAMHPELFDKISWSSDQVFNQTLSRAKTLGLKSFLLRTLVDVDTPEDWERFISAAVSDPKQHQSPGAN